ncbi:MAG: hypothetical protein Q7S40_03305 [Opitutaceae bacterium]|nr:hypothetical protein [Opitutaceae bacterium]
MANAAGRAASVPSSLPPVSGELSGEFTPLKISGVPALKWKVSLRAGPAAAPRHADLEINGPGTAVRGEAIVDTWDAASWRVSDARIEVAPWFAALAPMLGTALTGMTAEGTATIGGSGTLNAGKFGGQIEMNWRDGALRNSTAGWAITGVTVHGKLAQLPALASDGPVTLTFREANGAGIVARDGRIEFSVDFHRRVHVLRATMGLMEGRVAFTPFVFDPDKPEVQTDAEFEHVELSRFAAYLPAVLAEARGPVSGRMQVNWSVKDGLRSASGTLRPETAVAASIRLAPSPGFLTSRLPENVRERIDLLPSWFGPIRKLFRPVNPAYETLRAIEMGESRLELKTLELSVSPGGDINGRTARIVLMAKPSANESVVDSVRFEINVNGPLADLVKLGLEGRVKMHAR